MTDELNLINALNAMDDSITQLYVLYQQAQQLGAREAMDGVKLEISRRCFSVVERAHGK